MVGKGGRWAGSVESPSKVSILKNSTSKKTVMGSGHRAHHEK